MRHKAALILLSSLVLFAAGKAYEYFLTGNPADVHPPTSFGVLLAGGGKTPDDAYRWFIRKSGGGDFVVIRASGGDAMNPMIQKLGGVDSVETLVLKTPEASRDKFVSEKIRNAEALFIAGGDQWNYVRMWKNTPVTQAIQQVIDRGAPVGGTSAGLAVLGEYGFSAEHDSAISKDSLANPFNERVTIDRGFLNIALLKGVITDTHFVKRDRLGRLVTFMARILHDDSQTIVVSGIGVDEANAVLLEGDGSATLLGEGSAYFLRATHKPELCAEGKPLTFRNLSVYQLTKTGKFDLKKWTGHGGTAYQLSAEEGVLHSTKAGGSLY